MPWLQVCAFDIIPPPPRQANMRQLTERPCHLRQSRGQLLKPTHQFSAEYWTNLWCLRAFVTKLKKDEKGVLQFWSACMVTYGDICWHNLENQALSSNCFIFSDIDFLTHDLSGLAVSNDSCAGSKDLAQHFRRTRGVNWVIPSSDNKNLCLEHVWLAK